MSKPMIWKFRFIHPLRSWQFVRPALESSPSIKGETVQIHLDEPKKFTVETDGGLHDALFVFCSRRIEKPENTSNLRKGKVYNVGVLTLKPNDTVYIEEGLSGYLAVFMRIIAIIFPL